MSAINDFLIDLVRAANELEQVSRYKKIYLIDQAVIMICDMRKVAGIPPNLGNTDAVVDLQTTAALIDSGQASDAKIKSALLDAAGMIRDLHIAIDTKTVIQFVDRG